MSIRRVLALGLLLALAITGAFASRLFDNRAAGGTNVLTPLAVVGHVRALNSNPVSPVPQLVQQNDMHQEFESVHEIGGGGYIWVHGADACVTMQSGAGGCFGTFNKPVALYASGESDRNDVQVQGLVPDQIADLQLILKDGQVVPTSISQNGFAVSIPLGAEIVAEAVTLRNGQTFTAEDEVPPLTRDDFVWHG